MGKLKLFIILIVEPVLIYFFLFPLVIYANNPVFFLIPGFSLFYIVVGILHPFLFQGLGWANFGKSLLFSILTVPFWIFLFFSFDVPNLYRFNVPDIFMREGGNIAYALLGVGMVAVGSLVSVIASFLGVAVGLFIKNKRKVVLVSNI